MRNYFIALCLLLLAGCTKADVESVSQQKINSQKFHAEFAEDNTRTFVDEKVRLLWTEGDLLTIFTSTLNKKYQFDGETGDNSGTFSEIATSQFGTGNSISANYAVYPYFSSNKISNDEVITLSLPATQQYAEGSFGQDANTMVAVTSGPNDYFLPFKNVGGFLRLRLYGEGVAVKSIELKGNNSEKIAGKATVTAKYGQNPELEMSNSATESITLDCGDGVALGATAAEAKDFWIVVPPTTFTKGFTITITDTAGATMEKSTSKNYVVERNVLKSMAAFEVETNIEDVLALEREALIAFYNATGGDNWTRNDNWCSDKPVSEWYGVQTNLLGRVIALYFINENLTGYIPEEIGNLEQLEDLVLFNNKLGGNIPKSITQLINLKNLNLGHNEITGEIPTDIGLMVNLENLALNSCKFHGHIPESVGNLTNLVSLWLNDNRLSGAIPESICNLKMLKKLELYDNHISGVIPANIGNMESLESIDIGNYSVGAEGGSVDASTPVRLNRNHISGEIPKSIGNLRYLKSFYADCNNLTGEIPEELWHIPTLEQVRLTGNYLTGKLSAAIGGATKLSVLYLGNNCLEGEIPNELYSLTNFEELSLGNHSGTVAVKDFDSNQTNKFTGKLSRDIVNMKRLRILNILNLRFTGAIPEELWDIQTIEQVELSGNFFEGELSPAIGNAQNLTQLGLGNNHLSGTLPKEIGKLSKLEIFGVGNADCTTAGQYIEFDHNTQWNTFTGDIPKEFANLTNLWSFSIYRNNITGGFPEFLVDIPSMKGSTPFLYGNRLSGIISDKVLNSDNWNSWVARSIFILPQQQGYGFELDYGDMYESTDFSKDGEVKTLQTATKGDGIDIVLMGDAYSDRLIADGTYDKTMNTAMEKFFEVEPYKSFREYFNVYSVTAVSKNEVYNDTSDTALAGYFGGGTVVGGNDQRAFYYAQKAIGEERMDDALVVVMMNSTAYAGTCWMYSPYDGDWGNGVSVSYFPVGIDDTALAQVLHHEAAGHGFSKLGDEYAYEHMGAVPEWEVTSANDMAKYGWWKNIDFTSDPTQVKWKHFLTDSRYANEGLGVYEGAYTYWTGVWRPTYNSIMNTNVGGFNAPSREAIYYRIHKLAYGADWEYDYEEFVKWDAKNRATSATTRGIPYRLDIPEDFQPTHPPVVVKSSWREAKNNAPKKTTTRSAAGNAGSNLRKVSTSKAQITTKPMVSYATETLRDGKVVTITVDESGMTRRTVTK